MFSEGDVISPDTNQYCSGHGCVNLPAKSQLSGALILASFRLTLPATIVLLCTKTRFFLSKSRCYKKGGVRLYFFFDKLLKAGSVCLQLSNRDFIGEQLDRIDHLITLHQRSHGLLIQVKLESKEPSLDDVNVLVLELLNDVQIGFPVVVMLAAGRASRYAGDRDTGEQPKVTHAYAAAHGRI